jgi:pyruvate dehydrogenase E1 component
MPEKPDTADIEALTLIEERLRWLASWTIHNANHLRESPDGLKVGGHQASCASMTAIMAALYFHALGPNDKVAVKPHAGPVLHAAHYLLGTQSREQLENFRGFGGAQSYPSRTKDQIRSISPPAQSVSAWPSPPLPAWCRIISSPTP